MSSNRSSLLSPTARDLLAGMDAHVHGTCDELTLDGIEPELSDVTSSLNDAEANNLSFIVSDRFSRNDKCLTALESETNDTNYAQLAERVAGRLAELSRRLAPDKNTETEQTR